MSSPREDVLGRRHSRCIITARNIFYKHLTVSDLGSNVPNAYECCPVALFIQAAFEQEHLVGLIGAADILCTLCICTKPRDKKEISSKAQDNDV